MSLPDDSADEIFLPDGHLHGERFADTTLTALQNSVRFAGETQWDSVRSPHLFMGLLSVPDPGVRNWGDRLASTVWLLRARELGFDPSTDRHFRYDGSQCLPRPGLPQHGFFGA